jgi:hypothetical protein
MMILLLVEQVGVTDVKRPSRVWPDNYFSMKAENAGVFAARMGMSLEEVLELGE